MSQHTFRGTSSIGKDKRPRGITGSIPLPLPQAEGDPYYPVPRAENMEIYRKYETLAAATDGVHFVGRLATYKYYNMDQVVAQALALCSKITGVRRRELSIGSAA